MTSSSLFLIQLSKNEIKEFETNDFKFESLKRKLLNQKDFQTIDSFHHIENKLTLILNRLLCQRVCSNYITNGEELIFEKNSFGKPYLANNQSLNFNMSNCISQCISTMVVNNQGVDMGIDIANINDHMTEEDKVKQSFDYTLFNDILSEKEQFLLSKQKNEQNKIRLFTMIWAVKESFTKLIGLGLTHTNLKSITVFNLSLIHI